jgi:3-oxoacyl-[acyl-carrier protein] reductase
MRTAVAGMLAGKTAVVTGTAQGIGAGIAAALRDDGATVHGVDRDGAGNHGAGDHGAGDHGAGDHGAGDHGAGDHGAGDHHGVDLSRPDAVTAFFAAVGGVDILVNCAGGVCGQAGQPVEEVTGRQWRDVLDANLTTAFLCCQAVAPAMKARGWGRIINISSAAGLGHSLTGIQAYTSAKAAVIGLTRQLASELGPFGITVNAVAPGFIRSNPTTERQWQGYGPDGQRALVAGIAMRRLGEPADIANGVRFLAAPPSSWITGQVIAIDGGRA